VRTADDVGATSGASPVGGAGRRRWLPPEVAEALRWAVLVYVPLRLGLSVLAVVGLGLVPNLEKVGVPGWDPPTSGGWSLLVTVWERGDALWYLRIAESGYAADDGSAAFFPVYPLLVRGLSALNGGHPLGAGLVISNVACVAAMVVLYLLTREEFDRETARRTVLYLALFPTALFLFSPHTESLFLLLSVTAVYAARHRWWALAGTAGALAAGTRSVGVLLVVPLGLEALAALRSPARSAGRAWPRRAAGLGATAMVPVGLLGYLEFWRRAAGNWLRPIEAQEFWQREASWPWETVAAGVREGLRFLGAYPGGYAQADLLVVAVGLACAAWLLVRSRPTYSLYVLALLVVPLSSMFGGRPFMSLPRFLLVMFPLYWALARTTLRFGGHELVVAASAMGLAVFTLLFASSYFIF